MSFKYQNLEAHLGYGIKDCWKLPWVGIIRRKLDSTFR